jgi:ubiquitin C-terminal hydrolase
MEKIFPRTLIGIQNTDNVCYLNSVLQILFNIEYLNEYIQKLEFLGSSFVNGYKKTWNIIQSEKFFVDEDNIISSTYLKNFLEDYDSMYIGCQQHDAHEVLVSILNLLHEGFVENYKKTIPEILTCNIIFKVPIDKMIFFSEQCWNNEIKRESHSIINNLFKGQIRSKITCQECLSEFNKFDTFNIITLPIPNLGLKNIDINECIKEFCGTEFMCYNNKFNCSNCEKNTDAMKEISLWKLPRYLIFHFNRFIQNENEKEYSIVKNDTNIIFPVKNFKIDNKLLLSSTTYELSGSVIHHGNSVMCGHYTSEILVGEDIYKLDDETIEKVEEFNKKPYILIYKMILN